MSAIRVDGTREVMRAFRAVDKSLAREFGNDLKAAAAPVVEGSKQKVTRFRGVSLRTIRAKRSGPNVFVEQSARKVTGKRGDFGALQMRVGLIPALDENTDEVFAAVEKTLDRYANSAGF